MGGNTTTNLTNQRKVLSSLKEAIGDIVADNYLSQLEIIRLKKWLNDNMGLQGCELFDKLHKEIDTILADGIIEKQEMDKLLFLLKTENTSSVEKERKAKDSLSLEGKNICITGQFIIGDEDKVKSLIERCGGRFSARLDVTIDILIVGQAEYEKYKGGIVSARIKKAMTLKESINIISEEKMLLYLSKR